MASFIRSKMYFRDLPNHIKDAISKLPKDHDFQDRFGHDPVLDELDAERFNAAESVRDILATLNFKYALNGRKYNNITPIMWCYLWCIESPIVKESTKEATTADLDLFFYVLENGVKDIGVIDTATKSFGWCEQNGIKAEEAVVVINRLVASAFAPLKMFPSTKNVVGKQMTLFDADWITSLCAKVHSVTGYSPEFIMNKMSMTACCYYYIQYARMQGAEHIERRPDDEILKQQDVRACELIAERLVELNVIREDEKADLVQKMSTPPDK